jgi:hypothetical protein
VDQLFSIECKSLISGSREIALNLGYDYISTVHIFLADCESGSSSSIMKFAFAEDTDYIKFKNEYALPEVNYLDHINDSIPLTLEAESAIRLGEKERQATGFEMMYPFHIILGCFKAENSILKDRFRNEPHLLDKIMKYYKESGVLELKAIPVEEIASKQSNPFKFFLKMFKKQA